jgi:hypothetical protein
MSNNQLNDLSKTYLEAVYGGGKKEEPKDTRMVVTAADKKANTKAYQNMKAGNKAYKPADHLKDDYEFARHKASIISRGGRLEDAVESWNQKLAYREAMKNVSEKKEVDVKDTYKTVAAVIDYDRSKKGSKDATYDSMKGDKEGAKKERDYAAFERSKMKKDDPNWKSKKYHTGMHGEETEVREGYGKKKKKKHDCASKVKHEEFGIGNPVKGMHDLDESGNVAHYDVLFGHGVEKHVPVSSLEILEGHMHEHVIREKMAAKDYDGDGKIESGKDEYFGSKDKAIKKAIAKKKGVKEDIADILASLEKKRISKGGDPEESPLPAMRKYHADKKKKVKKESLSDWRDDLSDLIEIVAGPEDEVEKKVKEANVKNKVVINPKISEAIEEIGGEVLEHHQKDADGNTIPHDDVEEGKMYGYKGGGVVKKEVKALSTATRTMKGRNVAKADAIEEGKGKKNCGCGQDPCVTYGKQEEGSRLGKSQVDENRMAAHTAGMSQGQKDAASTKVSKGLVDRMGRRNDAAAFKSRKEKSGVRLSSTGGKKRANTTGRGQPEQYRKSADSSENEGRFPYGRSKIVQGKGSIKDLKKESVEFFRRFVSEADKKGKGSGKKDACYHKVKASAKVWPSAYASGRLVQCRKKGAANYGKGSD